MTIRSRFNLDRGSPALAQTLEGDSVTVVNTTSDPIVVEDDFNSFEAQHLTLSASTDTTVTFAQTVRSVRIKNWNTTARVLVKDGTITSDTSASASRVGKAPAEDVPASQWFPFKTVNIHLRSSAGAEVTVEGYY